MSTTNATRHAQHPVNGHSIHATSGEITMSTKNENGHAATQSASATTPAIDFASIVTGLTAVSAALGPQAVPLTIAGRRRLLKMRPGGEGQVGAVLSAVERYGLVLPGVDRAAVERDLADLVQLGPVAARVDALNALIGDLTAQLESRVWKATTTAYSTLVRYVPQYPALQRELAPIASLLAIRFKDAPTALRAQEKRTLAKSRATRKAKDGAAPGAPAPQPPAPSDPTAHAAPPPTPPAPLAPPAPVDPPGVTLSS